MIYGTAARVILMTIFVIPVGVITAIYLTEYAHITPRCSPAFIRGAVNNLAGVPSIVFGLFGLGSFINFIGQNAWTKLLRAGQSDSDRMGQAGHSLGFADSGCDDPAGGHRRHGRVTESHPARA